MLLRNLFVFIAISTAFLLALMVYQLQIPLVKLPNIIVVSIDTLRADHTGLYGYSRPVTPILDGIGRMGSIFSRTISQSSWTLPSHMSMMTSLYPRMHGVYTHDHALPDETMTLAESLENAGYDTAAFVTWVYLSKRFGFNQGFNVFEELYDSNDLSMSSGKGSFSAEMATNHAVNWLNSRKSDKPVFLFIHYFDPHMSYLPIDPYDQLFDPDYRGNASGDYEWIKPYIKYLWTNPKKINAADRDHIVALYDGEIRYTDNQVGRLLRKIDDILGFDNSLIAVVSDHGEEFFDHGSMEGHGWTLYNEIINVPMIIKTPLRSLIQRINDSPSALIDLAPTLLGYIEQKKPDSFKGYDFSAYLNGEFDKEIGRDIYSEQDHWNIMRQSICSKNFKLIFTAHTKYNTFEVPVEGGYELYHSQIDAAESMDIFGIKEDISKGLSKKLRVMDRWMIQYQSEKKQIPVKSHLNENDITLLKSLGYIQ